MRFRKDKDDGDGAAAAPPDAGTRVEEPTEVLATKESAQPGDPPTPHGDPLSPATPPSAAGPQSPSADAAPPSPDARVESPESPEPAKVLAPPTAATRVDAPPPQPGQLVAAAPPPATIACPQCGSAAEPGQEICIVCGSRIAADPLAGTGRDWKLPAALAGLGVLLIGVAIAFGVVQLTRDDDVKKDDVADLSPTTTAPPAGQPAPATPPPATGTPTTPDIPPATQEPQPQDPDTNTTPDTTPSPSTSGPAEWPDGRTAYTVVLVSATNRNAADAKAEQAVKRGIKAGVLRSDDFSSLRPGYWVVFAGQFDSSEEATRAADRYAEQGFGGGYPRQVKPKKG